MATLADDAPVYRRDSAMSDLNSTYEAVVVGAGPAGIVSVGNLLEKQVGNILWVDETFQGGRINQYYREVPSNTKTKLFLEFAESVAPFRNIVSAGSSKELLQDIRKLDQEKGCQLSHAADICLMLTSGLKNTPGVTAQPGRVTSATLDERSQTWNVNLTTPTQSSSTPLEPIRTKRLILCTGSTPLDPPLPYEPPGLKHINLDDALSPTTLRTLLTPLSSSRTPTTIAVIGASHSAILVLMNLSHIISSSPHLNLNVKWFTRHPLRYAEYDSSGHVSARDNTGLKGQAAVWAKENLEPLFSSSSSSSSSSTTTTTITSVANGNIQMIRYQKGEEENVYRKHLLEKEQEKISSPKFLIQAIGYMRNHIPTLSIIIPKGHTNAKNQEKIEILNPIFDHDKGIFLHTPNTNTPNITPQNENENEMSKKKQIPGLYGAGIAFPQKILDKKYLHEEMNVGFMKFMKAVKGWVGGWKGVGGE